METETTESVSEGANWETTFALVAVAVTAATAAVGYWFLRRRHSENQAKLEEVLTDSES
jgi:uncharacterized membrane protein